MIGVLFVLLLSGCDKDIIDQSPNQLEAELANSILDVPDYSLLPDGASKSAARALWQTYDGSMQSEGSVDLSDPAVIAAMSFTEDRLFNLLDGYREVNIASDQDVKAMHLYIEHLQNGIDFTQLVTLPAVNENIQAFADRTGITLEETPLTYYVMTVSREAFFTLPIEQDSKSDSQFQKGVDDGRVCTMFGILCPSNSDPQAATRARLARTAATTAAAAAFSTETQWNNVGEAAVAGTIAAALGLIWSTIFCRQECDTCAPAAGIIAEYNGCNFIGIRALGTFEFAEQWTYAIDANRDGSAEAFRLSTRSPGRIPASDLPTQPFNVTVNVLCDGAEPANWPNLTRSVAVFPPRLDLSLAPQDV